MSNHHDQNWRLSYQTKRPLTKETPPMARDTTPRSDYFEIRLSRQVVVFLHAAAFVLGFSLSLYVIAIWAQRNGLFIDLQTGGTTPTYFIAVLVGLLSFLSPCVLPLVPAYLGYLSRHVVESSRT